MRIRATFLAAASLGAALITAAPAVGADVPGACGTVTGSLGTAAVAGGGTKEPATAGVAIVSGDTLATARDAALAVALDGGARLRLAAGSRLRLRGPECGDRARPSTLRAELIRGALYVRLSERFKGTFRVAAGRTTVSGPHGARFTVEHRGRSVRVVGLSGEAARPTIRSGGRSVRVEPEHEVALTAGGMPGEARRFRVPAQPFWEIPLTAAGIDGTGGGGGGGISMDDIEHFAVTWLPILFFAILVVLVALTLRAVPRTKPQKIAPSASTSIGWDEIAGVEEAKAELREVVDFLRDPGTFKKLGATVPKGILLHGPPGTGKTLLAKAVAHESGADFFSQSAASFVEMFAGLGAARIRRLFKAARNNAPAIIFIDELDAVGTQRGSDLSGERDQTLNQLLVEMDGFDARENVVVIAASNLLDKLDTALLRPGRFDRQVFVPPPDREGRRRILDVHTVGKPLHEDVDLDRFATHTAGLTGADLANLCNEAAIFAGRAKRDSIRRVDFDDAFERVVAGLQSRKVITDSEKRVIAWHEAGHALVRELLPSVDRVQKISIVPRGRALGYTLNLPDEDRYLRSKEDLLDHMAVLLAGRVAEQLTFGRVTTGAADDLVRVTAIAHSMVYEYAMGTTIRSLQVPKDDWTVSEALKRTRDEEVQELADSAYRLSEELISRNRGLLDTIAETLLASEVIERDEIERIMALAPNTLPAECSPESTTSASL